ncbi:hypothetical protein BGZ98_008963 [Dissophora globulifera]|nr:hypothetical protein BGZ98_008963 [Dissophora globulifera]
MTHTLGAALDTSALPSTSTSSYPSFTYFSTYLDTVPLHWLVSPADSEQPDSLDDRLNSPRRKAPASSPYPSSSANADASAPITIQENGVRGSDGSVPTGDIKLHRAIDHDQSGHSKSIVGEISTRADVFAGVVIFGVGMLVLIVAMTFYFVNWWPWKAMHGRGREGADDRRGSEGSMESGHPVQSKDGSGSNMTEETKDSGRPLSEDSEGKCDAGTLESIVVVPSTCSDSTLIAREQSSPSTARLIEPLSTNRSVFAFLKGPFHNSSLCNKRVFPRRLSSSITDPRSSGSGSNGNNNNSSGNSIQNADPCEGIMDLPALKRIKARSSVKHKPYRFSSPRLSSPRTRGGSSKHVDQNRAVSINVIQATNSTAPALLRLDMSSMYEPRSSSIVGLYGSARSSPNGSLVDAASVQAMYCHSLKSTVSCMTAHADSTLGFDSCQDITTAATGVDESNQHLPPPPPPAELVLQREFK